MSRARTVTVHVTAGHARGRAAWDRAVRIGGVLFRCGLSARPVTSVVLIRKVVKLAGRPVVKLAGRPVVKLAGRRRDARRDARRDSK